MHVTRSQVELTIRLAYGAGAVDGHEFAHGSGLRPNIDKYTADALAGFIADAKSV